MNIELNSIVSEIVRPYRYSCLESGYIDFNELTGYLKSGTPLTPKLSGVYNEFGPYAQDLVNYDSIRYGMVGYTGNNELVISQIYAAGIVTGKQIGRAHV